MPAGPRAGVGGGFDSYGIQAEDKPLAIRALLFGVGTRDIVTFLGVTLAIAAVAALASVVPAWRAVRVDPIAALRAD